MTTSKHQLKLYIHIIELALIVIIIGFSVPRLFMKDQPRTRANTIALGMVCFPYLLHATKNMNLHKTNRAPNHSS